MIFSHADVLTLLDRTCIVVADDREISTISQSNEYRETYYLKSTKGHEFKLRLYSDPEQCKRIAELSQYLPTSGFSAIIDSCGSALLESWIDGVSIENRSPLDSEIVRCGNLMNKLHQVSVETLHSSTTSTENHVDAFEKSSNFVESRIKFSTGLTRCYRRLVEKNQPELITIGLTHNDICPPNIIMNTSGELTIMDQELISIDALASDLARFWYLWPMSLQERKIFRQGYQLDLAWHEHLNHFPFWRIYTLINSLAYHVIVASPSVDRIVEQLEQDARNMQIIWDEAKSIS